MGSSASEAAGVPGIDYAAAAAPLATSFRKGAAAGCCDTIRFESRDVTITTYTDDDGDGEAETETETTYTRDAAVCASGQAQNELANPDEHITAEDGEALLSATAKFGFDYCGDPGSHVLRLVVKFSPVSVGGSFAAAVNATSTQGSIDLPGEGLQNGNIDDYKSVRVMVGVHSAQPGESESAHDAECAIPTNSDPSERRVLSEPDSCFTEREVGVHLSDGGAEVQVETAPGCGHSSDNSSESPGRRLYTPTPDSVQTGDGTCQRLIATVRLVTRAVEPIQIDMLALTLDGSFLTDIIDYPRNFFIGHNSAGASAQQAIFSRPSVAMVPIINSPSAASQLEMYSTDSVHGVRPFVLSTIGLGPGGASDNRRQLESELALSEEDRDRAGTRQLLTPNSAGQWPLRNWPMPQPLPFPSSFISFDAMEASSPSVLLSSTGLLTPGAMDFYIANNLAVNVSGLDSGCACHSACCHDPYCRCSMLADRLDPLSVSESGSVPILSADSGVNVDIDKYESSFDVSWIATQNVPSSVEDLEFIGCYNDNYPTSRAFPEKLDVLLAPLACAEACRQMGYFFFGMQWNNQCFCGGDIVSWDGYSTYGLEDSTNTALPTCNCPRTSSEYEGQTHNFGSNRNCVYRTVSVALPHPTPTQAHRVPGMMPIDSAGGLPLHANDIMRVSMLQRHAPQAVQYVSAEIKMTQPIGFTTYPTETTFLIDCQTLVTDCDGNNVETTTVVISDTFYPMNEESVATMNVNIPLNSVCLVVLYDFL
jgi:hypothetical protein